MLKQYNDKAQNGFLKCIPPIKIIIKPTIKLAN